MDVNSYLKYLHTFYSYIAAHPWAKLVKQDHVYPARVSIDFKNDFVLMEYNLGFKVGKLCYVFQKLAVENMKKLESIIMSQEGRSFTTPSVSPDGQWILCTSNTNKKLPPYLI